MIKVTLDKERVIRDIRQKKAKAMPIVAGQFLNWANDKVKFDTGETKRSSHKFSDLAKGILRWVTSYVVYAYYMGTPSKTKNPNATTRWAHKTGQEKKKELRKMIARLMNAN